MSENIPEGSYIFVMPDSKLKHGFYRIERVFAHDDHIGHNGRPLGIQVQISNVKIFGTDRACFIINLSPDDAQKVAKQIQEIMSVTQEKPSP